MTDTKPANPPSQLVDGYADPERGVFILRFNRPEGGNTDHVALPLTDAAVVADMAALAVRQQLAAVDAAFEGDSATSFDIQEIPGAETVLISFRRGSQPALPVALPKAIAYRLKHALEQALPFIGGPKSVN